MEPSCFRRARGLKQEDGCVFGRADTEDFLTVLNTLSTLYRTVSVVEMEIIKSDAYLSVTKHAQNVKARSSTSS
jgi:hypothetical protein